MDQNIKFTKKTKAHTLRTRFHRRLDNSNDDPLQFSETDNVLPPENESAETHQNVSNVQLDRTVCPVVEGSVACNSTFQLRKGASMKTHILRHFADGLGTAAAEAYDQWLSDGKVCFHIIFECKTSL